MELGKQAGGLESRGVFKASENTVRISLRIQALQSSIELAVECEFIFVGVTLNVTDEAPRDLFFGF